MTSLNYIIERIEKKKADYQHYNFSQRENTAIKTFFDLAQEFDSLDDLYMLSVAVPKSYYDLDARLYVVSSRTNQLSLAASTLQSDKPGKPAPAYLQPRDHPYITGDNILMLTLRGKRSHIDQLPFKTIANVIGVLEVLKFDGSNVSEQVFFEKYANRIGYNIHNRFIAQKNVEHLKFIKSLVADIEHNIIVPNIIYKLYLRNLKSSIDKTSLIERQLRDCLNIGNCDTASLQAVLTDLAEAKRGLLGEYDNLEKHYKNMSMFLEALLRRSHFDQGRLILRTTPCNINKEIVKPQLERFIERMHDAGIITDDNLSGIPDEDIISVVDIGLMSQVYANLFSNALKYTQEVHADNNRMEKQMAYGRLLIPDYFGEGKDGLKFNVFTTGPHVPPDERDKIFEDEYRGSNAVSRPGTGHGLAFIKNVIEIHGGVAGYEATHNGNNFYFILPKTAK